MYGGLNRGRIDTERPRTVLAGLSLPRFDGGRLVLAVDVSPWLRSDAPCSAERLFCHVHGRAKTASQFIPGGPTPSSPCWSRAPPPGPRCWTRSASDRRMTRPRSPPISCGVSSNGSSPRASGRPGDPAIVIVSDAGYDVTRLAWVLRDLPVELVGRVRYDPVMRLRKRPRRTAATAGHRSTARSSASSSPAPGPSPPSPPSRRPKPRHGTESTQGSLTDPHGSNTMVNFRWSTGRGFGCLRPAHPAPSPPGVQEHPRSPRLPDPCSPTHRQRPRTAG
ncbi:transposase [Streptomyces sp. NPDC059979]|uniref:transposase n=1 Tax=Streptomyces sp. NPDC059979 TaxID=3347021 RepID=UPI0036A1C411